MRRTSSSQAPGLSTKTAWEPGHPDSLAGGSADFVASAAEIRQIVRAAGQSLPVRAFPTHELAIESNEIV